MPSLLERLPAGSRIAVIRLRSLGDCVLTTPALALLKAHRPDLQVAVVVEDRFREVFEGNPDVERILPPQAGALLRWRPRMVLNLHGGTRSMALAVASRASLRAGFAHHRYGFLYSDKIPRAQEILGEERPVHTAEHIASAMFWMGVRHHPIPRAIPRARLFLRPPTAALTGENYAVLHPFASEPAKTWPAERFLAVAAHLRTACDLEPVFVAGSGDDTHAFESFRVWRGAPLNEVKSLMAGAQIFIGNDSGPAHIAAAFGVPVVAVFGASNPATWAPWRTEARVLTSSRGIEGIEAAEVIAAVEALRGVKESRA
jgi:heptosyltransferase III